ncbi:MAG: hypothetical protein K2L12_07395 [Clostridia bacterium]|nr:hypothetical protein [Clostridia bacterium]
MQYDIIPITQTELKSLTVVQTKMLRTAQQKKDELYRKAEKELASFSEIIMGSGMVNSSLYEAKKTELENECKYQSDILADNLIYNMSLNEPTTGDDIGGDGNETGEQTGYIVDYSLSYNERYVIVRNYYLSIQDRNERMSLYMADDTAKKYLASYYSTLYDVLYTYSR